MCYRCFVTCGSCVKLTDGAEVGKAARGHSKASRVLTAEVTDHGGRDFCCWKQVDYNSVVEYAPHLPWALDQENQRPAMKRWRRGPPDSTTDQPLLPPTYLF